MKVCHMTSAHSAEDIRIFHKECVSLAKAGYEVYLVARGETYDKNGVHIVGVGDISGNRRKRMTEGAKRVYKMALALDCDLYHFHDPELLPYGLKLKKRGKKVIYDSHEHYRTQIIGKEYLPAIARRAIAKLYGEYEDHVIKKIDGVIFPCPMDGKFPFTCKHTAFVDNAPILNELYDRYDPEHPKLERTVCLIGSLSYSRGLFHAIKAVAQADCRLLLGGTIVPASYEEEIKCMPESSHVEFLGRLDRPQVLDTMQRSRIGLSTPLNIGQYDRTDNLATKVCEYMSLGLPVILTRHSYNERALEQYKFGLCVDPENTEEYAEAIRKLIDDPELASKLGENGRKAVAEKYNWNIESSKLLKMYQDVIQS